MRESRNLRKARLGTRAVPIPIPKESQFQFLGLFWHLVEE